MCIYHFWRYTIYCSSVCTKLLKRQHFRFFCRFSRKIVQISIFKVEYFENGMTDFNDFGLILQDFQWPFKWNQLVLALQFFFKGKVIECRNSNPTSSNGLKAVTHGNTWKSSIPGQNFSAYSTKMLITFFLRMQIHQGINHFVPQEAGFRKVYNSLSESLQ